MKKSLLVLFVAALAACLLVTPAFSADTGSVTVTSETAVVSVSVSPSSVGYGLVPLNATGLQPITPNANPAIFAINSGNCWVDLLVRGADTTHWTLGTAAGPDTYVHYFGYGLPAVYTPLTESYQQLSSHTSLSPGTAEILWLQMDTPTSSTTFGTETTSVTVMAEYVDGGIQVTLNAAPSYTVGDTAAVMTATVTDDHGTPMTGLAASVGGLILSTPFIIPTGVVESGTPGQYTITYDLSSLAIGTGYLAIVNATSGTDFAAASDLFDIVP